MSLALGDLYCIDAHKGFLLKPFNDGCDWKVTATNSVVSEHVGSSHSVLQWATQSLHRAQTQNPWRVHQMEEQVLYLWWILLESATCTRTYRGSDEEKWNVERENWGMVKQVEQPCLFSFNLPAFAGYQRSFLKVFDFSHCDHTGDI